MPARSLKVVRSVDDAETVLFETHLNADEFAELEARYRVADPTEGTPEFRELEEKEDPEKVEGAVCDFVLVVSRDIQPDHFELYKAADGWRFRRVTAQGEVVADSGEAYKRKTDAKSQAEDQADGLEVIEV
jgi:uncharacterized protein YegP (UPF0339 family)